MAIVEDALTGGNEVAFRRPVLGVSDGDAVRQKIDRWLTMSRCSAAVARSNRFAASNTILSLGLRISSISRRANSADETTLASSGSMPRSTPAASAAVMAVTMLAVRSPHASGDPLSGCARHMSAGSRVPVQSVTKRVPIAGAAAISSDSRLRPSARSAVSGWIMLKVPETATMPTPVASVAARMASGAPSGIASGSGSRPEQARLYCATVNPAPATAESTVAGSLPAKVLAKMPSRIRSVLPPPKG